MGQNYHYRMKHSLVLGIIMALVGVCDVAAAPLVRGRVSPPDSRTSSSAPAPRATSPPKSPRPRVRNRAKDFDPDAKGLEDEPTPKTPPGQKPGIVSVEVGLGGTGCTGNCAEELAPMAGLRFQLLVRLHKHISIGAQLASMFMRPSIEDAFQYAILAGAEVRANVHLLNRIEFWTGLSLGYMRHQFEERGYDNYEEWQHGVGLGWGLGVQYTVAQYLALGAAFWLYAPFFLTRCEQDDNTDRVCSDAVIDNPAAQYGLYWTVGGSATVFLGQ